MKKLVDVVEGRVGNFISDNSRLESFGQTKEKSDKSPFQNNSLLFPDSCSNNQLQQVGVLLNVSHCLQELFSATLDSYPPPMLQLDSLTPHHVAILKNLPL